MSLNLIALFEGIFSESGIRIIDITLNLDIEMLFAMNEIDIQSVPTYQKK